MIFFSVSLIFCYSQFFLTKLVTLGILFLTAVTAQVVAKLVILGISLLTSFLLHCLVYLNQQEQVLIYQHLIYLLYF